jgi:uncharacterized protein (TIRG00374 family)
MRLAVSVVLLTRLACRTDWSKVQAGFVDLRWEYWMAAVGLLILAQFVSALRWKYYTDRLLAPHSVGQLTGFNFIGMYFNLMLPTSVGGDVVRAWYLDRQSGRWLPAFASVLLDRLNGLLVLVALACLAVTLSPLELPSWITWSVWSIAGCGMFGLAGLLLLTRRASRREPDVPQREGMEPDNESRPAGKLAQLRMMLDIFCLPRILVGTLVLSLFVQAANVLVVWLIGQALHAPIPTAYYWVLVPMVSLLTLLPISVNGMGVREEATVLFLAPLGIAEGTALTLSVLWFAAHASVSLCGGAVYLFGHFPKPETPAQTPAGAHTREVTCGSLGSDSDQGRTGQHRQAA